MKGCFINSMLLINEHKVSQVICLNCFRRWIAARPVSTWLYELECPDCRLQGFVIKTGETGIAEELLNKGVEE